MKKIGITIILGIIIGTGIGFGGITALSSSNYQSTTNIILKSKPSNTITALAAKSIILNKIPGSIITNFNFENIKTPIYQSVALNGTTQYTVQVNALTGVITSLTTKKVKNSSFDTQAPVGLISESKAIDIASSKITNSKLTGLALNYNSIAPEYDIIMQTSKDNNYICINAKNGKIISSTSIAI